ncbi:MAG: flagellar biosynthetic protein FliO [Rhodospirillales bacterium]|jgi:flagellar protein FliO/FliZ|nr:flagellar biosynthetic protein FliO [Rhodospirillales bacterium]
MEIEGVSYIRFAVALLFVLGLITVLAVAAKRFGLGNRGSIGRGKDRRLTLIEAMPIDTKRRLILVRRDDREHLILLGQGSEQVIETSIAVPPMAIPETGADRK